MCEIVLVMHGQFVIFARRMLIALLSIVFSGSYATLSLFGVLALYALVEFEYRPFVVAAANRIDVTLSWALGAVVLLVSVDVDDGVLLAAVAGFAVAPFLLLAHWMLAYLRRKQDQDAEEEEMDLQSYEALELTEALLIDRDSQISIRDPRSC